MSIIISIAVLAFPLGIAALVVWMIWRERVGVDIRQVYFYLVALATLLIGLASASQLVWQMLLLLLPYAEPEHHIFTQRGFVSTLSFLLVVVPVWWWHWQRARQRALQMQGHFGLRLYLYAIMIITLLLAVFFASRAGAEIFKILFSSIDVSNVTSVRSFWHAELSALGSLFITLIVWFYHWRSVERMPADQ